MKKSTPLLLSVIVTAGLPALAQDPLIGFRDSPPVVPTTIANASQATKDAANPLIQGRLGLAEADATAKAAVIRHLVDFRASNTRSFLKYVLVGENATSLGQFLSAIENSRLDKQIGAGPNAAGSTSLVSKASIPAILSAAVENGALTQTVSSGSTTTFRGNLVGIGRLLLGEDQFPFCPYNMKSCDNHLVRALKPISFTVSTDSSGQNTANVPISGVAPAPPANSTPTPTSANLASNAQRVSAWSARYVFLNPHALDSKENRTAFAAEVQPAANTAALALNDLLAGANLAVYATWVTSATAHMTNLPAAISQDQYETEFAGQLDQLIANLKAVNPQFDVQVAAAWKTMDGYFEAVAGALQNSAPIFSIEYTSNRPLNQPRTSDIRAILASQVNPRVMLTANFAATWYDTLPAGVSVGRFRDAQASGQVDISMGKMGSIGKPVFSAAGYFQYMHDPSLLVIGPGTLAGTNIDLPSTASVLLGQKGNIGIGQVKLSIPFKNTGVTFPIAVTWANRTELIKANDVRGHIGISFDLDALFAKSK